MQPNADDYNPDPQYLRDLLAQAKLSQRGAARLLGVSERQMRYYLQPGTQHEAPYPVQFCLECLAEKKA